MHSVKKVEKDDKRNYSCFKKSNCKLPSVKTVSYRLESIRHLGQKIWKLVPDELKELTSVFKKKVTCLKFEHCPCNLCKNYIYGGLHR